MAKIEITWTFEARLWLKEIYEYIAQNSPKNAQKVVAGIREKAQMLRDFPEMGQKYEHPSKEDVRILLYFPLQNYIFNQHRRQYFHLRRLSWRA